MEDKVWRHVFSFLFSLVFLILFTGGYFSGERGWWWMTLVLIVVTYGLTFHFLEPD